MTGTVAAPQTNMAALGIGNKPTSSVGSATNILPAPRNNANHPVTPEAAALLKAGGSLSPEHWAALKTLFALPTTGTGLAFLTAGFPKMAIDTSVYGGNGTVADPSKAMDQTGSTLGGGASMAMTSLPMQGGGGSGVRSPGN